MADGNLVYSHIEREAILPISTAPAVEPAMIERRTLGYP